MIEIKRIEGIKIRPPKWKWWQVVILVVAIILALKVNPSSAGDTIDKALSFSTEKIKSYLGQQ